MALELRHVRYFLAVVEERNFTRAAARVGIGQPPLSQQIKDLETEVGAPLFRRVAHGAELTAAGAAFLELVNGMPDIAARATKAAQRAARGETGGLRVGFTASAAFNPVVPAAIRSFRRAFADVDLTLEEANTTRLVAGLKDGALDSVFLRPGVAGGAEIQFRLLSEEPIVLALPKANPLAEAAVIDLAALENEPFILFPRAIGPTLYDAMVGACRTAGFEPRLGQIAPQLTSVVNLVAAELGVSMVPASLQALQVEGVVYREMKGAAPVARLALATRRGETSAIVRNFIDRTVV